MRDVYQTQAAFSYIGTEIVAIAAGEAKNPRKSQDIRIYRITYLLVGKNIPKAIKRVYIRILLFYIGGVTIIGMSVISPASAANIVTRSARSL